MYVAKEVYALSLEDKNIYRTYVIGNLFDYSTSGNQKPFLIRSGSAAANTTEMMVAREPGTGVVSSITFTIGNSVNTFAVGSRFSLYGIVA